MLIIDFLIDWIGPMSSAIIDLSGYGDVKGRDTYSRNLVQSVKGLGTNPNVLTHGFYGISSTDDSEYELARLSVSEGAVDDQIGTLSVAVGDGTSLNDVLTLNNVASEITSTTFTMSSTDVVATGTLNISTIQQNDQAQGSRLELVSDATDPALNFVLGDLGGSPYTPLIITQSEVAVTGTLTIGGVDVYSSITDGNPWTSTGAVTQLKADYNNVEINVANDYTTSVSLDVNGSARFRGNSIFFYDEPNTTFYNTLTYSESSNQVRLQSSKVGDSVVLSTSSGTDNSHLDRLTFDDGSGTQNAIFSNVNVGINSTPSGTYSLEVDGNASFSTGVVSGGDVNLADNNVLNVNYLQSSDAASQQSRIALSSDATDPKIDFVVGDLTGTGTPTTVATFTETLATVATPATFTENVTISGDLTVEGTQVILNTTSVEVEDISIEVGNAATLHSEINGGGLILGSGVAGITTPSILYSNAVARWESSVGFNVPSGATLGVGASTEVTDGEIALNSDSAFVYFGANKQWRLGIINDADGDHFQIAHDDLGTQTTWETKLDVLQ